MSLYQLCSRSSDVSQHIVDSRLLDKLHQATSLCCTSSDAVGLVSGFYHNNTRGTTMFRTWLIVQFSSSSMRIAETSFQPSDMPSVITVLRGNHQFKPYAVNQVPVSTAMQVTSTNHSFHSFVKTCEQTL